MKLIGTAFYGFDGPDWHANTAPPPPQIKLAPTLSGTSFEGQSLSAGSGEWVTGPGQALTFAWSRCDSSGDNCVSCRVQPTAPIT